AVRILRCLPELSYFGSPSRVSLSHGRGGCLVSEMHFCAGLAPVESFAERRGSQAGLPLKGRRKMALIGVPGGQGDFGKRRSGGDKCMARAFKAQIPQVVAYGAAILLAKHTGQMRRMHTDGLRQVVQRQVLREPIV